MINVTKETSLKELAAIVGKILKEASIQFNTRGDPKGSKGPKEKE